MKEVNFMLLKTINIKSKFKKSKLGGQANDEENDCLKKEMSLLSSEIAEKNNHLEKFMHNEVNLKSEIVKITKEKDKVYNGNKGLMEEINFLKFRLDETSLLHDQVVLNNWQGTKKNTKVCLNPFERIEILPRGEVYTCCSADVKHNFYIGNLFENDIENIWNSENAKKLRYSVSEGNFEYCNRYCKWLHSEEVVTEATFRNESPIRSRGSIENIKRYDNYKECIEQKYPTKISLICDESCNLQCPTCRSGLKMMSEEESEKLYNVLMEKLRSMLADCRLLTSLGSGEIFASKAVMKFYRSLTYKEFPNLKLDIITNAQLFTQSRWSNLENLHEFPILMNISIDAADKETYEAIRLGGKWKILKENLEFIKTLRIAGNIEFLRLNFVVQKMNYLQIEDFVKMAIDYNTDVVEFKRLGNWGSYTSEEYKEINVCDKDNENNFELIEILNKINREYSQQIQIIENISKT